MPRPIPRTVFPQSALAGALFSLALAGCPLVPAMADEAEPSGLLDYLPWGNPNGAGLLKSSRITVGGWLDSGLTINPAHPRDRFNGTVTFGDRNAELQLNQLYAYLERPVNVQGETFDMGGRFDFLFGTDAVFTQANGDPAGHWDRRLVGDDLRFYQAALPQAYLDFVVPVGTGLRVKMGHFYTIIGNETVMAPDNFFYSHAYLMQYGEPFTHTGILGSYAPIESLTLSAGAVTGSLTGGWDGVFDRDLGDWGFLGGVTWASDGTTVSANASHMGPVGSAGDWNLVSVVVHHDFTGTLHYTAHQDYGWADRVVNGSNAEWYGTAHYLEWDFSDTLALGLRGEWFRDDDGFRVQSRYRIAVHPAAGGKGGLAAVSSLDAAGQLVGNSYQAITLGLRWTPLPWATIRPSLRYDWTDDTRMFACGAAQAPQTCSETAQWTLGADAVLMF